MSRPALLAIDLGTSGVKVSVVGAETLEIFAEVAHDYAVASPHAGWAETEPDEWWTATVAAVGAAVACAGDVEIAGIGLDGQMHGLVLMEEDGTPVRPALLWADRRAAEQAAHWRSLPSNFKDRLGNPVVPGMTGPLWAWVADNEPAALARTRWALLPKDWLRHRLNGAVATEPSDASATLLWDVPADDWHSEVLDALGLDSALLPPVIRSAQSAGPLGVSAAAELALAPGIPVAAGAGDTPAALRATGLSDPSSVQVTVGTGGQVVRPVDEPVVARDPVIHMYRRAENSGWYAMAAVQNAGLALDWVRGVFGASWEELYGSLDVTPPGAEGVTFVPYLTGERTPVLSDTARGAFFGLDLGAGRASMLRAAVEGVTFAIRHAFDALPGPPPTSVRIAGGGTRDEGFRGLLAAVLGRSLEPLTIRSASALGAALLAAEAAGVSAPPPRLSAEDPVEPPDNAEAYAEPYERYKRLAARVVSDAGTD